jgi:uncharacterized protein
MNILLSPSAILSSDGEVAISTSTGAFVRLSETERSRIERVRLGPLPIETHDFELLERGILAFESHAVLWHDAHVRRVSEFLTRGGGLCVMPTEKCNLRCTYCYQNFAKGRISDALVNGLCRFLASEIPRHSHYQLAWFGGEPLIEPSIIGRVNQEARSVAAASSKQLSISITTNGTLFTDRALGLLRDGQVNVCQVTVDGPALLHDTDRIRLDGRGSYREVMTGIERVLTETSTDVLFRVNVHSDNPESCDRVRIWLRDDVVPRFSSFADRLKYNVVSIWSATTSSIQGMCIQDLQRFNTWMTVKKAAWEHDNGLAPSRFAQLLATTGSLACYAGKPNHYVIGSDGTVYKCTVALDREENHVGVLTPEGALRLDMERAELWTKSNSLSDSGCAQCVLREACIGIACPLVRLDTGERPCPTEKKYLRDYLSQLGDLEVQDE